MSLFAYVIIKTIRVIAPTFALYDNNNVYLLAAIAAETYNKNITTDRFRWNRAQIFTCGLAR